MAEVIALTNLDFEYELASQNPSYRPLPLLSDLSKRWRFLLRLLPGSERADCLNPEILQRLIKPHQFRSKSDRFLVWGVTPRSSRIAGYLGLEKSFPPVCVVRTFNDKRFSHRLEKQLNVSLPYSGVIDSPEQLQNAVKACPHDWVLKHPFGVSGRERMVGKASQLSESALGWARRRFRDGWSLLFEPWVEQRTDFSFHFQIDPDSSVHELGYCHLLPDPGGVYRGNRVTPTIPPNAQALEVAKQIAAILAERGYWGPLGIDSFCGLLGKTPVLRPLVEINARHSFGRLALALSRYLPHEWSYLWWHPNRAEMPKALARIPALAESSGLKPGAYSLPVNVDPQRESGTILLTAPTPQRLQELEASLIP